MGIIQYWCHACLGCLQVLLEVTVGVGSIKDPVLEVIQFEKYRCSVSAFESPNESVIRNHENPCQELLYWLFPLDRTIPPPRPLSPPLGSSISQKLTSASGSQIFNFNHFRSYSMPSLPQGSGPPPVASYSNSKSSFDVEDYDRFSPEKPNKNKDTVNEGLLSFRGVSLEPQRFSARCGLEGMYLPGRRWRRKLEIIQPLEICSFGTECNTEDLLCVQIKVMVLIFSLPFGFYMMIFFLAECLSSSYTRDNYLSGCNINHNWGGGIKRRPTSISTHCKHWDRKWAQLTRPCPQVSSVFHLLIFFYLSF